MYERVCPRRCTNKCTFQGAMFGQAIQIWDVSIVNENCRLVLAGTGAWVVQFGNFLQKEGVIGEVFAEPLQPFAGGSRVVVAQVVKSQKNPGKRHKETTVVGDERQFFYTLCLITFESAKAQHPADRSSLAANNVFTHSGG